MVSFRGQKKLGPRPDWSPLGVSFKISDEHPPPFYMRRPPPPPCPRGEVVGFRPVKRKKIWHRMITYFQPLSHEKRIEEDNLKFVISDSYGVYFQPLRCLKHFLYCVSEPIVVDKSLLEDIC